MKTHAASSSLPQEACALPVPSVRSRDRFMAIALAALLAGVTALVFWPITSNNFVNYDDPDYITNNIRVQQGFSLENVGWAFTTGHAGNYHPFTWISLMIDRTLWGSSPLAFHLTNVLLHAINCALLLLVLRAATGSTWRAALAASLFALHPLRVESVAWATERKDVLSMFFIVSSLSAYVWYARGPGLRRFACVALLMECALLSKSTAVTLPAIFLLLDFWPLRRVQFDGTVSSELQRSVKQLLVEKMPLVALSIIASIATMIAQSSSGAVGTMEKYPLTSRLANAAVSYIRYVRKMIRPNDLAIFYPNHQDAAAWMVVLAFILLGAMTFFVLKSRTRRPWLTVGWLWFVGAMIPMIGLVQSGAQSMADRFTYLPMIGIAIVAAWAVPQFVVEFTYRRLVACGLALTVLITLSIATRQQIAYWHDSQTVFEHALAVTNDNHVAHNNLAFELARQQKFGEAREHYLAALRIHPTYSVAHNGLGTVYVRTGNRASAIQEFELAVKYNPPYEVAHRNLGVQFAAIGQIDKAIEQYQLAIALRPDDPAARSLLGMTYATQGRLNEAAEQFQAAVADDPSDAQAKLNLGHALVELKRPQEALIALRGALLLDQKLTEAHYHAGVALAQLHDTAGAAKEFGMVLKSNPNDRAAQVALQQVLGFPQQRTASAAD